jgi:hypothetical protein
MISQSLDQHAEDVLYRIPLAKNFRRLLMGIETRPRYIVPQNDPRAKTTMIGACWIYRWLSQRIEQDQVLAQVASHCLAHPIQHGAQVKITGEEEPKMLSAMTVAAS